MSNDHDEWKYMNGAYKRIVIVGGTAGWMAADRLAWAA
jgi:hypothetical protein